MSPWGKSIRKKLADCVTVTILIGICSLASVKKHPHKKPFNSARCSHGLTQQTLPQWDLFIPYLNKELFKVLFFSAVQLTLIKRGKYTAKVTHSHCASAVGWTFWMCGCFWLIEILSFVEEVKQGRAKRGKEDKIATKKEEKKDKEGKKSRGSSGKSVGVGMLGEPWVLGTVWSILRLCILSLSWFPTQWKRCCCWEMHLAAVWAVSWPMSLFSLVCPWLGSFKQQKAENKRWEASIFHFSAGHERGSRVCQRKRWEAEGGRGSCTYRWGRTCSGAGGLYFTWKIPGKALHWSESDQSLCHCLGFVFL